MFAEDAEWQIRRNSAAVHGIMTALFRRRRRLLAIVATIVVFYLIVIFVPIDHGLIRILTSDTADVLQAVILLNVTRSMSHSNCLRELSSRELQG